METHFESLVAFDRPGHERRVRERLREEESVLEGNADCFLELRDLLQHLGRESGRFGSFELTLTPKLEHIAGLLSKRYAPDRVHEKLVPAIWNGRIDGACTTNNTVSMHKARLGSSLHTYKRIHVRYGNSR